MKRISLVFMSLMAVSLMIISPAWAGQSQSQAPLVTVTIPNVTVEPGAQFVDVPILVSAPAGTVIDIGSIALSIAYAPLTCDEVTFPFAADWDDVSDTISDSSVFILGWNDLGGEDNDPLIVTAQQPVILATLHLRCTAQHPATVPVTFFDHYRAGTSIGDRVGFDFRLKLEPGTILFDPTGIDDQQKLPHDFKLANNYPNPFNANTTIRFAIPADCHVRLVVYKSWARKSLLSLTMMSPLVIIQQVGMLQTCHREFIFTPSRPAQTKLP